MSTANMGALSFSRLLFYALACRLCVQAEIFTFQFNIYHLFLFLCYSTTIVFDDYEAIDMLFHELSL